MDGSHPRTWWRSCKFSRIGAHAWICTPEEKGKLWKKHRKVRCSSSKCKKFVLFSDHFCAHCGEANEKFDPVEEATNKEGQRTGWLGKRPGEFDPKSLAAEFEESFVEETKVIVGDLLADLNTRSGKGKVVADIGKVVSHKDLADIATAALKDPADIAKAAHKEPEAEVGPMWDLCDWAQVKACVKAIIEKDENGLSIYDKKIYGIKHMDQYWKLSLNADQLYSWETNELGVYPVWKIIRKHINDTFEDMELDIIDCYATGRTSNAISFPRKDTNNTWTILYYVNPIWELEWEGQTNFYTGSINTNTDIENEPANIIKSIYPKPGRIVLFHSTIPHAETAPSRIFPGLKTTLVFKCFISENLSNLEPAVDPGRPKEHIIGKKEKDENI